MDKFHYSDTMKVIPKKENITIPREEYDKLVDESRLLQALQNAGVDNWEWYGEALEEYLESKG